MSPPEWCAAMDRGIQFSPCPCGPEGHQTQPTAALLPWVPPEKIPAPRSGRQSYPEVFLRPLRGRSPLWR